MRAWQSAALPGLFSLAQGSNFYLLSGELMTKLTGRHLEFELFTLSFDEYLGMKGFLGKPVGERRSEFEEYLRFGGFPRALT